MFDQSKTICTSLNQVPAQVKVINWDKHKKHMVLDYGAGKYPQRVQDYLREKGVTWIESYDPYNSEIDKSAEGTFDVVLCSNVLNVLSNDVYLHDVLFDVADHVHNNGVAYIQIYLGDRTSTWGETPKGFQRNAPMKDYFKHVKKYFGTVKALNNRFICTDPLT
jgi:hypothetical protein